MRIRTLFDRPPSGHEWEERGDRRAFDPIYLRVTVECRRCGTRTESEEFGIASDEIKVLLPEGAEDCDTAAVRRVVES